MIKSKKLELSEILRESAQIGLRLQEKDGAMPAGHNGFYGDPETPVSNTAHWAQLFNSVYDITADQKYRNAARLAASFLISRQALPYGVNFYCRKSDHKFRSNGLVGQSWVIEALAELSDRFPQLDLLETATNVFLRHPFNRHLGIWKTIGIENNREEFDMIFNHQLWFAAAGALLAARGASNINEQVRRFLDRLQENITVLESGLIFHPLLPKLSTSDYISLLKTSNGRSFLDQYGYRRLQARTAGYWNTHSLGYHSFNLYAFALLNEVYPDHSFWESQTFKSIITYARSKEYMEATLTNKYGFAFNPTGIEIAYALEIFTENAVSKQREWLQIQFERCYDPISGLMALGTPDRQTHAARLYEATRLPNLTVECTFLPAFRR